MNPLKCIAVDDEPLALDVIRDYVGRIPFLKLEGAFDNAMDALKYIQEKEAELIFLDIQMDDLSGIQLMKILGPKASVIFTTAYDQYALEGYELDVIDYLLKPIPFERFLKAAQKAYKIKSKVAQENASGDSFFFLKTEYRYQKVFFDDILYVEGKGDYLKLILKDGYVMSLQSFSRLMTVLPAETFIRIHKSYIVSLKHIDHIEKSRVRIRDNWLPVSETYRKDFYSRLGSIGLI